MYIKQKVGKKEKMIIFILLRQKTIFRFRKIQTINNHSEFLKLGRNKKIFSRIYFDFIYTCVSTKDSAYMKILKIFAILLVL